MDLKKLATRALSGLIYIAIVTGLICCGYPGVLVLGAIFTILATVEFDKISSETHHKKLSVIICDVLANLCIALCVGPQFTVLFPLFIVLLFSRYVVELYSHEKHPLYSLSTSLMSMVYVGFPMACMTFTAFTIANISGDVSSSAPAWLVLRPLWALLAIFVFIWINDTGAFITGSLIGRHRMSPTISPKKTWEGLFGGMIFTIVAAIVAGIWIFTELQIPVTIWGVYGLLVSLFATWGDLTESLIKRNLGLKDSGRLLPGHGGILDRIDSLLFVMPLTALIIIFMINNSSCFSIPPLW